MRVCVSVCMCVCVCACECGCVHVCMRMRACKCMSVSVSVSVHVHVCICLLSFFQPFEALQCVQNLIPQKLLLAWQSVSIETQSCIAHTPVW